MTYSEVENKLIHYIASLKVNSQLNIAADVPFNKLGIDSLGLVEILVFIEKTFDLKLIDSGLDKKNFETINSLASFIYKKL